MRRERLERPVLLARDRRPEGPAFGQVAPSATHAARSALAGSGNGLPGGILSASSAWLTAWISRLPFGSPGTTAGPPSPPSSIASRESSRSPPLAFFAPWHLTHVPASTGRTLSSKNASGSSPAQCNGPPPSRAPRPSPPAGEKVASPPPLRPGA